MKIPFLDWFRSKQAPEPQAPPKRMPMAVSAHFIRCPCCERDVTTWRTYGDGRRFCVQCATKLAL